jgi:hypothetical protein
MDRKEKLESQRREWDEMQRRGHVRYFLLNVLIWIGSFAVVEGVWQIFEKMGWLKSSGMTGFDALMGGLLTGGLWSELHWSDMKRKFRVPPPEEDWMTR